MREENLKTGTNELEILTVLIGDQIYGINVDKVESIEKAFVNVAKVPKADERVIGLTQYRGSNLSLISLIKALKAECSIEPKKRNFVVTHFNEVSTGFEVSSVTGINRISWDDISPVPDTVKAKLENQSSITGIANVKINKDKDEEPRIVLILDLESILADVSPSMYETPAPTKKVTEDLHVVLAEDSPTLCKMVEGTLKSNGIENVRTFPNGKACLDYLRSAKDLPDVVITDIEMPELDGLTMTKYIREDGRLKHLPVLVFSSMISDQMKAKCKEVGADYEIAKPQLGELVDTISAVMEVRNNDNN